MIALILIIQQGCAKNDFYYKNNKKVYITKENSISRSGFEVDYYLDDRGLSLGILDTLIVKTTDKESLDDYVKEYNLLLEKQLTKNLYLLKTQDKDSTIAISNTLHEKPEIEFAHPNFIKKIRR